jgi:hypothetical protein
MSGSGSRPGFNQNLILVLAFHWIGDGDVGSCWQATDAGGLDWRLFLVVNVDPSRQAAVSVSSAAEVRTANTARFRAFVRIGIELPFLMMVSRLAGDTMGVLLFANDPRGHNPWQHLTRVGLRGDQSELSIFEVVAAEEGGVTRSREEKKHEL